MKLNRIEVSGIVAAFFMVVLSVVFLSTQSVAYAQSQGESITTGVYTQLCENGMIFFSGCVTQEPTPTPTPVPVVDPCTIFDLLGNLPPNCDSSGGGNGGGGNGGGGGGGTDVCTNETTDPGVQTAGPCNADDVCPDMAGVQTATTDCQASGGGGGTGIGTETGGVGGGSGGGAGGGSGYLTFASTTTSATTTSATTTGVVLGSATSTSASCDMYLTAFIKFGNNNDVDQVKRLQHVLKMFEGAEIEETGEYDTATRDAVHSFQTKYADVILAPWNIKQSTGFVYLTTRKKVNEIYCSNQSTPAVQFPLTEAEAQVIEMAKVPVVSVQAAAAPRSAATAKEPMKTKVEELVAATSTDVNSPVSRPWGSVGSFLRRVFNRGE